MTTKQRTEILINVLELISDKKSQFYDWYYSALSNNTREGEYTEIGTWMTNKLLGRDKDFADFKCQEKQTLLCLAIAINDFKEATK